MFRLRIKLPSTTSIGKYHKYHCRIIVAEDYEAYQTWPVFSPKFLVTKVPSDSEMKVAPRYTLLVTV